MNSQPPAVQKPVVRRLEPVAINAGGFASFRRPAPVAFETTALSKKFRHNTSKPGRTHVVKPRPSTNIVRTAGQVARNKLMLRQAAT